MATYRLTARAGGVQLDVLHRAGWTDAELLDHGIIEDAGPTLTRAHLLVLNATMMRAKDAKVRKYIADVIRYLQAAKAVID